MKAVWNFFSSVRLAVGILCLIAFTSIFGTIIPQGNSAGWYSNFFRQISINGSTLAPENAEKLAAAALLLDLDTMYSSWWFLGLFFILSINLVVCSLRRIPPVLKIMRADNLAFSLGRLEKMPHHFQLNADGNQEQIAAEIKGILKECGWKAQSGKQMIFSQKHPWSRLGVYVVHFSLLVIFAGVFIGSIFGYKGNIILPEGQKTSTVFSARENKTIELGFSIFCNFFDLVYYPGGMPKEYKSGLTIIESGQAVLTTEIVVNKPLKYKGVTFYQSSYEPYQDFIISIAENDQGVSKFTAPFQQQIEWHKKNLLFGIINAESVKGRLTRVKLWISDGTPVSLWLAPKEKARIKLGGKTVTVSVKQMYATGLQVSKDPGVWLVYLGFMLMLAGLYISFFMSHKRIWFVSGKGQNGTQIDIYGIANKNPMGFAADFDRITRKVEQKFS